MTFDYYSILGVDSNATMLQIRQAFKKMALLTHPDKKVPRDVGASSSGATSSSVGSLPAFVDVTVAAAVLMDPIQRAQYDGQRLNTVVRTEGRISSVLDDVEDVRVDADECSGVFWGTVECRCGGEYRFLLRDDQAKYVCECDSCSLVIEVRYRR